MDAGVFGLRRHLAGGNEADFQCLSFDDHAGDMAFDQLAVRGRAERTGVPRIPIALHLAPNPADRIFANSAEPIIRLTLDGTVVRVRLDKKSTSISLLVALGVRQDGQMVLLAVKNMGGESEAAWRALLDDLVNRGLKTPGLVIVDGAPGLEKALAALWPDVLVQRFTVHKHRNLLAHTPQRLHEEISADYKDMIYADTEQEVDAKRKAFIRKWRLKCPAVAASLEEAGDKLFTFTRFPNSGNSSYVVLGSAGFGADHNAQSRRLADPQRKFFRSDAVVAAPPVIVVLLVRHAIECRQQIPGIVLGRCRKPE
jgi:hypothetical protein